MAMFIFPRPFDQCMLPLVCDIVIKIIKINNVSLLQTKLIFEFFLGFEIF
jgi:hypothetical protein